MTTGTASAVADGFAAVPSQAAGVHTAFLWGAFISLIPVVLSFFIKRPATALPEGAIAH